MNVVNIITRRYHLTPLQTLWDLLFFAVYVVIHLACLQSLLNVYFSTTVVQNVQPLHWNSVPDARRLVLIVSDGLRADKFFELDQDLQSRAPFLRDVIENKGSWGVSHTRAPTESRSAHTAMLGGFYEDPSTIRAFFQSNPVEFDTVLNESKEAWSYGAYDVIPFFNKGTAADHVHTTSHRYSAVRLAELDKWVFANLEKLFHSAKPNTEIRKRLHGDKIIFFLHLAGIDSNGHAFHPNSKQYLDNIRDVDDIVRNTVNLFEKFYGNDNKTAFIFTSDHGMTDSGGHGGGHPNETSSPFVAWGSGINRSQQKQKHDKITEWDIAETRKWKLDHTLRHDLQQIDISVLMAAQIGVPFPVNSVGKLPLAYLPRSFSTAEKAYGRVKQIVETLETKKKSIKNESFHFFFWHYHSNEASMIAGTLRDIAECIDNEQYNTAVAKSVELTEFTIRALSYYHNFSNYVAFICTLLSIGGFMTLSIYRYLSIENLCKFRYKIPGLRWSICIIIAFIILMLRVYTFRSKWMYYIYVALPFGTFFFVLSPTIEFRWRPSSGILHLFSSYISAGITVAIWFGLMIAGFYSRICFSILAIGSFVYLVASGFAKSRFGFLWFIVSCCLAIFPLLPEIATTASSTPQVLSAGFVGQLLCVSYALYHKCDGEKTNSMKGRMQRLVYYLTLSSPGVTSIFLATTYVSETVVLVVFIFASILPFCFRESSFQRLTAINCLHISVYLLISESFDAIFFVTLITFLHLWVVLETDAVSGRKHFLKGNILSEHSEDEAGGASDRVYRDIRIICIFIFFLLISFFGLHSVQGLNHFRPRSLPFLPVSSSFHLLVMFIFKLLLHIVTVVIAYCTLMSKRNLSIASHWYLISTMCEFMVIYFYLSVKTSGSWADIGFSVANVCIAVGLPVAIAVLLLFGKLMVTVRVLS